MFLEEVLPYKLVLYFPVTALLSTISQKQQQQTNKQKNKKKTQKTISITGE